MVFHLFLGPFLSSFPLFFKNILNVSCIYEVKGVIYGFKKWIERFNWKPNIYWTGPIKLVVQLWKLLVQPIKIGNQNHFQFIDHSSI